ncbi:hypothetical protein [Amphritea pacifica]|uniref:Uncharacterized protein n=1 Tax=Amphritea pacifica TaxID=2811233 RepID=A0ABS2W9C0_9GAMM|nr:hypothetical protein [Amphritea pacifica]MBN0988298.1 hypothetical protein [Amphritea pacifica]MBN1005591.1 hypothetical protein [Amphritea pacifica]
MKPVHPQVLVISKLQQRAMQLKSLRAISQQQSLNMAANEQGFNDYQHYLDAVRKQAIQKMLRQSGRPQMVQ